MRRAWRGCVWALCGRAVREGGEEAGEEGEGLLRRVRVEWNCRKRERGRVERRAAVWGRWRECAEFGSGERRKAGQKKK